MLISYLGHNIANVCHRNIHARNVLINQRRFKIKISDFSHASTFEGEEDTTPLFSTSYINYQCPEFNSAKYRGVKADIWACGVILYFMIYKIELKSSEIKYNYFFYF
jgi:serine/threonine protein kinase